MQTTVFPNESTLIERAQRGDRNAFNQLVLHYQNLAYSVALQTLQEKEAAADAVQDTFLRAFRALPTFQGYCFKRWLMRILVNRCYDFLRVRRRRKTDSLDALLEEDECMEMRLGQSESLERHAERMELQALLEEGIRSLSADQRLLVVLCDIHGHDYGEIAEMTGLPMGTVKSQLSRARGRLRCFLVEHSELLPEYCMAGVVRKPVILESVESKSIYLHASKKK